MDGQLSLDLEAPLRFNVMSRDGRLLDSFTEAELLTAGTTKVWQEASLWASLAVKRDERMRYRPRAAGDELEVVCSRTGNVLGRFQRGHAERGIVQEFLAGLNGLPRPSSGWGACDVCGWCATPGACVWSIACPECGAGPGAQCRRPGGLAPLHQARHDAIVRVL